MARIEPFRGLRPAQGKAKQVASPPYDVLSSKEAKELTANNPVSFLRIIKPEVDLPDGVDVYSDEVYAKARENLDYFINEKILVQDRERNFYIYKQVWKDHVQVGLVAGASCRDYQDDVIKKHEYTRPDKENDRIRHMEALNAHTGPVFMTFKQRDDIDALFEKAMQTEPECDFVSPGGVRHILFVVNGRDLVEKIREAFTRCDHIYVADGHHRSASATKVKIKREKENSGHTGDEEYNFFLSVLFPDNQVKILSYNRVVKDLNGLSREEFFNRLSESFDWEETGTKEPGGNREFGLYIAGKWYLLKAKEGTFNADDPVGSLDISILQKNLLDPVLGIKDQRKDKRIDFIGGIRGTAELERRVNNGDFKLAITIYPTSMEQLFRVADSGEVMPPKSTWFEPKLESGMVTHLMDDRY
ncbi:MAG: DUF1015 domain-containing protein [bacterium]|nr:DUF1015 domain-containing protein [bacterium]